MSIKNSKQFIIIFITLILFMFTSCIDKSSIDEQLEVKRKIYNSKELDSTSDYYNKNYQVYTLEGCEYICVDVGNGRWGSHKGNCKNPIHKQ